MAGGDYSMLKAIVAPLSTSDVAAAVWERPAGRDVAQRSEPRIVVE